MNYKHFFVPGDEITEEQRQAIKELENRQHEEREQLLKSIPHKEVPQFMSARFAPYEDRVLVYPEPVDIKTKSGIIIPGEVTEKIRPVIGTVVRIGPGKYGKTLPVEVGDRIYYGSYAGTPLSIDGIDYLIMRFSDCLGKAE